MHLKSLLSPIHQPNDRHALCTALDAAKQQTKTGRKLTFHSHFADAADRTRDASPRLRFDPGKDMLHMCRRISDQ